MSSPWREAQRSAQSARNRALAERQGPADPESRLASYLADLARARRKEGYSIADRRCVLCRGRTRLRVGVLSGIGTVLFCPQCEPAYRLLRGEEGDDTLKVHWADDEGVSACGIGWRVTTEAGQVTCLRCQLYVRQRAPALIRLVRSLL